MPAPTSNQNGFKSGLRSKRALVLGTLPPSCRGIVRDCASFRRALELAVIEARGELDLYAQAVIATAAKWERHSALALRWLRNSWDKLNDEQRLRFHEASCRAAENRDRCLKQLGLDSSRFSRDADTAAFDERFQRAMQSRSPRVIDAESGSTASAPPAAAAPTAAAAAAAGTPADDQAIPPADATGEPPEAVAGDVVTDGYARPRQWSR